MRGDALFWNNQEVSTIILCFDLFQYCKPDEQLSTGLFNHVFYLLDKSIAQIKETAVFESIQRKREMGEPPTLKPLTDISNKMTDLSLHQTTISQSRAGIQDIVKMINIALMWLCDICQLDKVVSYNVFLYQKTIHMLDSLVSDCMPELDSVM